LRSKRIAIGKDWRYIARSSKGREKKRRVKESAKRSLSTTKKRLRPDGEQRLDRTPWKTSARKHSKDAEQSGVKVARFRKISRREQSRPMRLWNYEQSAGPRPETLKEREATVSAKRNGLPREKTSVTKLRSENRKKESIEREEKRAD